MKKKWLIAIASCALAVTVALGISACGGDEESGKSDEETAQTAVNMLNSLYLKDGKVKNYETPDDFKRLGQVNVEGTACAVVWTADVKTAGYAEYVKVGTEKDSGNQITIDVSRATVDIEYTLTASVTVNEATKTTSYEHKIPKKSSETSETATLDLSKRDATRTQYDENNNIQVWSQNGVTLTNTGSVGDYEPIRLYKNTTVKIEMEGADIIHIDFHSAQGYTDSPYPDYLKQSLEASDLPIKGDIAVSEDGLTFSVDFETPLENVTFKITAGQCRLTSIDVEGNVRTHTHQWTYEHIEGTWTHKATCTAEGCDVKTRTEDCSPVLNECVCGKIYSAKEIVDALFALETGKSLPGSYTLTGVVTEVTELNTTQYYNVTFKMTVEDHEITVYRAKGDHYTEVAVGGTATVNGELLDYGGTKEFTQGGSVVAFEPGVDERSPQEKVTAALNALASTFTVTKTGETALPTANIAGVTFTWATTDQTYTITNNKINVTELPESDATVNATVTATYGSETLTDNTKQVTITIKAKSTTPTPGEGNGTKDSPFTVSQALGIINGLESYAYYTADGADPVLVYIQGIVTVKGTSDGYGIKNYYVADVADDVDNDVLVFSLNWSTAVAAGTEVNVGDTILIQAYLQNYNGTPEITYWREGSSSPYTYHNGYIEGHTPEGGSVTPEPGPGGDTEEGDASISFADTANRDSITANEEVWSANGITVTHNKGTGSDIDTSKNYSNPIRIYKNHTLKIEYTSAIAKIVFHSDKDYPASGSYSASPYFTNLKSVLEATFSDATITSDDANNIITVVFATPSNTVEFTSTVGQARLFSLDIFTDAGTEPGGDGGDETHVCGHVCEICGKCTDNACEDPVCADKCEGHTLAETDFTTTEITELKALVSESGKTTTEKYFAIGLVKSIKDDYNSEIYIVDEEGNELLVYRLLNEDGTTVLQTPSTLFTEGDTIVVYGVMTNYNGKIEMQYAWLVQINSEAKTDEAKLLLLTVSLPAVVDNNFDLPVVEGVTYAVQSGEGIAIQGNKATVTRTDARQEVVIRATASVHDKTATKDFTVVVKQTITDSEEISVTVGQLLAGQSPNAYSASGSNPVDCYMFSWTDVGNYGLIQMRKTKPSSFWNTDAFTLSISKVEITWASKQQASTNNLKIELSNNKDFTGAQSVTVSAVVDQKAEVTASGTDYVYIRVTQSGDYAVYIDEVKIICAKQTSEPETAQQKVENALKEVSDEYTVTAAGDYNLPTSTVGEVTFSWAVDAEHADTYPVENGVLKVGDSLPDVETTLTLTLTANCGEDYSTTKQVTIIISAKESGPVTPSGSEVTFDLETACTATGATQLNDETAKALFDKASGNSEELFYINVASAYEGTGAGGAKPSTALLKLGASGSGGKVVLGFKKVVTSVTLKAQDFAASGTAKTISVNGEEKDLTVGSSAEITFTLTKPTTLVTISSAERAYIFSIKVTLSDDTAAAESAKIVDALTFVPETINVKDAGDYVLPTSPYTDVTFSWVSANTTYDIKEGTKLDVKELPKDAAANFNLTVTATCGSGTQQTKQVAVTVDKYVPKLTFNFESVKDGITLGSALSNDAALKDYLDDAIAGQSLTANFTDCVFDSTDKTAYTGDSNLGLYYLKLGSSSKKGNITLNFSKNVTKVVIEWRGHSGSEGTLYVNDMSKDNKSTNVVSQEWELASPSQSVTINAAKRAYIKTIIVYFEEEA